MQKQDTDTYTYCCFSLYLSVPHGSNLPREGSSPSFLSSLQLQTLASPPHTVKDLYRGIWKSQFVQMSWT